MKLAGIIQTDKYNASKVKWYLPVELRNELVDLCRRPGSKFWWHGDYVIHPSWIEFQRHAGLPLHLKASDDDMAAFVEMDKKIEPGKKIRAKNDVTKLSIAPYDEEWSKVSTAVARDTDGIVSLPNLAYLVSMDDVMSDASLAKLVKSALYKKFGLSIPERFIADFGERAKRIKISNSEVVFDICVRPDWRAGEFGESTDSCWWKSYNAGRLEFIERGGRAMRFFDTENEEKGVGRCWLWPLGSGIVLFNAYYRGERIDLAGMGRLLAGFLYDDPVVSWVGTMAGIVLYVNNQRAVYIGPKGTAPSSATVVPAQTPVETCDVCGKQFREYTVNRQGYLLCKECEDGSRSEQ